MARKGTNAMSRPRLAVLGGGIMGAMTALYAARRGAEVVLFERNSRILCGASRYNEGKIHLGCLYSASKGLDTARQVLPGGLQFQALCEDILEQSLDALMTPEDDLYLVHPDSVVTADTVSAYMRAIADLVADHPDRPLSRHDVGPARFTEVSKSDLGSLTSERITTGFRVPERSVATQPFADLLEDRVLGDPNITVLPRHTVFRAGEATGGRMSVETDRGSAGAFDAVVNALWEGRPAVDLRSTGHRDPVCHHRFRLSAFVTNHHATHPSAVVCAGPFGDIKAYGGGRFYVSWYPAGLLAQGEGTDPPAAAMPSPDHEKTLLQDIAHGLGAVLPGVAEVFRDAADCRLGGGWVYAQGRGSLDDPASSLHKRNLLGVRRYGRYFSVDTGKFSTAPLMAKSLAEALIS